MKNYRLVCMLLAFAWPGALPAAYGQDIYFRDYTSNIMPLRDSERPVDRGCNLDESSVTTTLFVDGNHPDADDSNPGTESLPLKTINKAVKKVDSQVATRIVIKSGVYREEIRLNENRNWSDHAILIIEAESPGSVTLNGADIYTDWVEESGYYVHDWNYKWGFAKTEYDKQPLKPAGKRTELVAIGDTRLKQYLTLDELTDGSFFVDEAAEKIYMIPPGGSLSEETVVEVGIRRRQLEISGRGNMVIRGLNFIHSRGALDYATLRLVFCSNVLVEDCLLFNNSTMGLLTNVCTNLTIRNVESLHNGGNGYDSYDLMNSIIDSCNFSYNCWRSHQGQIYHYFPAGSKNVVMKNCLLTNNEYIGNLASGCWFDVNCEFIDFENNVASGNNRFGIYSETNCGPISIHNNIATGNNYAGIEVAECWNVTVSDNTMFQNKGTQLGIRGTIRSQYGQDPRDWTYAPATRSSEFRYRYRPANLVVTGNVLFADAGSSDLISHGTGGRFDMYHHVETYSGDDNIFYNSNSNIAVDAVPIYSDSLTFQKWNDVTLEEWTGLTGQDGNSQWLDPQLFYLKTFLGEGEVGINVYNDPGTDSVELYIGYMEDEDQGVFFIDWNDVAHYETDYEAPYTFDIQQLPSGNYMFFGRAYTQDGREMTSDRIEYKLATGTSPSFGSEVKDGPNVKVYPNPNNGHFTLSYSSDYYGDLDLHIYNAAGQRVYQESFVKKDRRAILPIALNSAPVTGIYLVQWMEGGSKLHKRVAIHPSY